MDEIMAYVDKTDLDFFDELQYIYTEARQSLQKEICAFYAQYAKENKISIQEAKKRLMREDLSDYRSNAEKYFKQAEKDPELLKRLNEQYKAGKVTRLEALQLDITYQLGKLSNELHTSFESYLKEVAKYAYRKVAFGKSASTLNLPALKQLIETPFNGKNYSQSIWGNVDDLAEDLKKLLIQAFIKDASVGQKTRIYTTANSSAATDPSKFDRMYFTINTTSTEPFVGTVLIENIKVEQGTNATPYQPNLLDDPYWLGKAPLGENIANKDVQFPITTTEYSVYSKANVEDYKVNQKYVLTMKATKPAIQRFIAYLNGGTIKAADLYPVEGLTDTWQGEFTVTQASIDAGALRTLAVYQFPSETKGTVKIEWIKLEKGNIRTPNIGEYKYRGTGMRDSNNPYDYVWDIEPSYVENNLATDIKVAEITGKANNYTDGKVAQVNSNLLTVINTLEKRVSTNSNNILDNTTKIGANTSSINTIRKSMPLFAVYGEGTDLSDVPTGTKLPIGALIATDFAHTASDLPYTISSDGNTLTATRNCVLLFEGSVKLHGNNTIKYAYVKIRKNGSDTNFANVGSSAALNYMTAQAGQYVHTLVTGDKVEFTVALDTAGKLFHTQLLSLKISEIKPV